MTSTNTITLTSSHVNSVTIASSIALRLRCLAPRIHSLGVRPLFELLCEMSGSSAALDRFEVYAQLDAKTLDAFGGRDLPPTIRLIQK
jgi:hypothetical protein